MTLIHIEHVSKYYYMGGETIRALVLSEAYVAILYSGGEIIEYI